MMFCTHFLLRKPFEIYQLFAHAMVASSNTKTNDSNAMSTCHNYDVVYGPIADDGVTFQLRRFKAGAITIERLVEKLKYSKGITFQYFLGTELAISKLRKL